jgi:hypothetical protein
VRDYKVDLTEDDRNLFTLIERPREWRLRAVERIDLASALWAEHSRSVHAHSLGQILGRREKDRARAILPIGTFPKNVRIDLDIEVDGKPAYLLSRESHGKLKAEYLRHHVNRIHPNKRGPDNGLLVLCDPKMLGFLGHVFSLRSAEWHDHIENRYRPPNRGRLLLDYLHKTWRQWDSEGDAGNLTMDTVDDWLKSYVDPIGKLVRGATVVPSWRESATENPLLAVPSAPELKTCEDVTRVLARLHQFLRAVKDEHVIGTNDVAKHVLDTYALFGTYWIILAECVVPLDGPFLIKTCEKRVLDFGTRIAPRRGVCDPIEPRWSSWRPVLRELVQFKDAISNHVNVRSGDYTIELKEHKYDVSKEEPPPEDVVDNRELFSYYSSSDARLDRLWFTFRLRQTTSIRVTLVLVWTITAATIVTMCLLPVFVEKFSVQSIAGLLFPASIAASLLLTRSNSTLGMRVNRIPHYITASLLILLVAAAIVLFSHFPPPPSKA